MRALRIVRGVQDMGAHSVAKSARDDEHAPHVALTDDAVAPAVSGPAAYLNAREPIDIDSR
ncbi:hypothetical protein AS156_15985 [Bradyrhizobium macuxiense]|uniref:Biotin carboxylase-like N-terminal domain-containing protein n=1 Tax=Bradyrhizobium macuxiense TaxID=1755647 RepID=A0A109JI40_9BRAD|nr:hypothetical protein AS156_15985 [Bradyrhizobium macuxiense]